MIVLLAGLLLAQDQTGTVSGIVSFKGDKPERKPFDMSANAFCKEHNQAKAALDDRLVFGKDDSLANVLVYVSKGLEGKKFAAPKEPVVLDQIDCVYTPHVVAVMVGQTLEIRNSDPTLHNVMSMPRNNDAFNDGMPVKGGKLLKVFSQPELKMDLRCFMHKWMLAYVHVLDHPFFAVTREDGAFTIKGLPPGEYEVSVLHEFTRFEPTPAAATVKVVAGETKKIAFEYRVRSDK